MRTGQHHGHNNQVLAQTLDHLPNPDWQFWLLFVCASSVRAAERRTRQATTSSASSARAAGGSKRPLTPSATSGASSARAAGGNNNTHSYETNKAGHGLEPGRGTPATGAGEKRRTCLEGPQRASDPAGRGHEGQEGEEADGAG